MDRRVDQEVTYGFLHEGRIRSKQGEIQRNIDFQMPLVESSSDRSASSRHEISRMAEFEARSKNTRFEPGLAEEVGYEPFKALHRGTELSDQKPSSFWVSSFELLYG